jgi:tRNA pseudouridine38-40 synthase
MLRNIRLRVAYDGTGFAGWQVQPDQPTVQAALEKAIKRLTGETVSVLSAGRTDAGVHAFGQVANFRIASEIPLRGFVFGINQFLPETVSVREAEEVPLDFHATFDAVSKTYRYLIAAGPVRDPFLLARAWQVRRRLDVPRMQRAAQEICGTHDFRCFETQGSPRGTTVRTVFDCRVFEEDAAQSAIGSATACAHAETQQVTIEVTGDGFLYNMVRTIAGSLREVGLGKWSSETMRELIASGDRRRAGPTAPACGLYLVRVDYPRESNAAPRKPS